MSDKKHASLFLALLPVLFLIVALFYNVFYAFGSDGLSGSNQIILIIAASIAAVIAVNLGWSWSELEDGIVESISSSMRSMLILLIIGSLSGAWLISGIVPAMIYYGLKILSPEIFLFAACIISAVVSLATGTSWGTVATVGVALLGIGQALGFDLGLIAGAIISGAYFGDKMSPLSDTTNLAPAMAGTDLFTHIRHMVYTTAPSMLITLILFLIIGFNYDVANHDTGIDIVLTAISTHFNINLVLFIVPLIVIVLIVKKVPALPALLIGTFSALILAVIFQSELIFKMSENKDSFWAAFYTVSMKALYTSVSVDTGNEMVNGLLSSKGMSGMLNTIWLILCSMIFGGIMEKSGLLKRITESIIALAHSTGSLIASTIGTCFFFNVTASDQYLAIVVPGRMFAQTYKDRGLAPENLSRALEDSGTLTSVLIPWNTCGATQSAVLKVPVEMYWYYCFFNLINPFVSIIYGYLNITITRIKEIKKEGNV